MPKLVQRLTTILLRPIVVAMTVTAVIPVLYFFEKQWAHMPFVMLCILALTSLLFLVTARAAFSFYAAMAAALLICVVSTVKYRMKGFDLHVYDLFFTGSDGAAFRFLLEEYAYLIIPIAFAASLGAALVAAVGLLEKPTRTRRGVRLAAVFAVGATLPISYPLRAEEPRYFHYLGGYNASSFFISLLDLQYLANETQLVARLRDVPPQQPFSHAVSCSSHAESPDVFMVLSESQTDPAYFPQYPVGRTFSDSYRSQDGKNRQLLVETFGGGTWISNLSVMTGLSSADFGAQSPYLTMLLEDRISGSIPALLARCGYRTVAMLPMQHSFVNEGPFLESIGFETVLDYDAIGATNYIHRDRFYFEAAEALIREHRRSDRRPLLLAMQTMFPHSPYVDELSREVDATADEFARDPELNEYLRRMQISRVDFQDFLTQREKAPSERGTVVLEFGDHQSFATKELVDQIAGERSLSDLHSLAYRTYYTFHAFGHETSSAGPDFDTLDIGFLGASFMEWARLPTSPMIQSLLEVRDRCQGKFHLCPDRKIVDTHLRRRVDSGMLRIL